ncbi:MAG: ABC-2 family transporter protein [Caldilineaceae bacterium]|nr:ABC-2 family transporter protein [Caldilineaceae bacterium]
MRYYADLYLTYWQLLFKAMSQYRADFLLGMVTSLLHAGSYLVFIAVVFARIPQLDGWRYSEMLLIYGLTVTSLSLRDVILDVPHRVSWYVQSGGLDMLLVRPANALFLMSGEAGINVNSIGRTVIGIAALVMALGDPSLPVAWWWTLYLPLVTVTGTLMVFGLFLMLACLSFWFTNVSSALTTVSWTAIFGQFPVTIYTLPLRFVFSWIIPFAMIGFYPAAFLLRGEEYRVYGLIAPLMGIGFLALALWVWSRAIRRYQSTGS